MNVVDIGVNLHLSRIFREPNSDPLCMLWIELSLTSFSYFFSFFLFHIFNRERMKGVYRDTKKERKKCGIMSAPPVSRVLASSSFTQHRIISPELPT